MQNITDLKYTLTCATNELKYKIIKNLENNDKIKNINNKFYNNKSTNNKLLYICVSVGILLGVYFIINNLYPK
jgi:hypothetical protein